MIQYYGGFSGFKPSIFKLVGGSEHVLFFHILGIIIPTDELIFFRGVETTNQIWFSRDNGIMMGYWDISGCILW
jgi:hypothetical protein